MKRAPAAATIDEGPEVAIYDQPVRVLKRTMIDELAPTLEAARTRTTSWTVVPGGANCGGDARTNPQQGSTKAWPRSQVALGGMSRPNMTGSCDAECRPPATTILLAVLQTYFGASAGGGSDGEHVETAKQGLVAWSHRGADGAEGLGATGMGCPARQRPTSADGSTGPVGRCSATIGQN